MLQANRRAANAPRPPAPENEVPPGAPRNEQGLPYREAGDDCCPYYRFLGEPCADYRRCGWCRDFSGDERGNVCLNANNRRQAE